MKNLHLLKTDKPSILGRFIDTNNLFLRVSNDIPRGENVNIYITSDEEINNRDCYIYLGQINKRTRKNSKAEYPFPNYQKIVLTTDQDLIEDGVQATDDEFLEWFVKNPNCEQIGIEEVYFHWSGYYKASELSEQEKESCSFIKEYKIIIPKEEDICPECGSEGMTLTPKTQCYCGYSPKEKPKQETLEEAAKNYGKIRNELDYGQLYCNSVDSFKAGAKWQQEQNEKLK